MEMLILHKIYHLKLKLFFLPCPGIIMKFSSLIIDGIFEARAISFDPVLWKLNEFSAEPYSVSFEIIFC